MDGLPSHCREEEGVENDENDTGKEVNKEYTEPAVHTLDYVENGENDTGKEVYKEYTEPAVHTLYYVEK
jgi:hypothetical protein